MKLTGLLGSLKISSFTNLDLHLLIFIVPFFIILVVYRNYNRLTNLSSHFKNDVFRWMGITLLALVGLVFVEDIFINKNHFNGIVDSPIGFISNLDVIISFVLGLSILTHRFTLARTLVPAAIVLAAAKLINNPGVVVTTVEIISAIALMSCALIFVVVINKPISLHGFGFIALLNVALLISVLAISSNIDMSNSAFSVESLAHNVFYKMVTTDATRIAMFITWTLVVQIIIFVLLRHVYLFKKQSNLNLLQSFVNEKRELKTNFLNAKKTKNFQLFSVENISDEAYVGVEMKEEDEHEVEFVIQEHHDLVKVILPYFVHQTINNKGIRAPSL